MIDFPIMLSSAGRRVALLRILRSAQMSLGINPRLVVAEMQASSPAFVAADAAHLVPPVRDPRFIQSILDVAAQEGVRLIIPTIDTELPIYAEHRALFHSRGIQVAISGPQTIRIANDKHTTHEWLMRNAFPTPRQIPASELLRDPTGWQYPLFAKPAAGSRSVGARIVKSAYDLESLSDGQDYIVQSIARGIEYTVDVLVDAQGQCVCTVPRRRLETRSGEVSKGMTVRHPRLQALVRDVVERLPDAFGPLCVQVFHDPVADSFQVIEVNPRFGGGFPLSWEAGAHFPLWMLQEMLQVPSSANAVEWRSGLVMLRFDDSVFADAEALGLEDAP